VQRALDIDLSTRIEESGDTMVPLCTASNIFLLSRHTTHLIRHIIPRLHAYLPPYKLSSRAFLPFAKVLGDFHTGTKMTKMFE
jgi:hypothetical protein